MIDLFERIEEQNLVPKIEATSFVSVSSVRNVNNIEHRTLGSRDSARKQRPL